MSDKKTPYLDERGHEVLSDKPHAATLNMRRPPTLAEQIRTMIRQEQFAREMGLHDAETFEEADDFSIEDDDPQSPYEEHFDPGSSQKTWKEFTEAAVAPKAAEQPPSRPSKPSVVDDDDDVGDDAEDVTQARPERPSVENGRPIRRAPVRK